MRSHQQTQEEESLHFTITAPTKFNFFQYKLLEFYFVKETKELVAITELKQEAKKSGSGLFDSSRYTPESSKHYSIAVKGILEFKPGLLKKDSKINIIVADQKELEMQQEKYKDATHFFSHDKSKKIQNADIKASVFYFKNDLTPINEAQAALLPRIAFREQFGFSAVKSDEAKTALSARAAFR